MKVLLVSPLPPPVGGIATVTANMISYFETNPNGISLTVYNTSHNFRSITSSSFFVRFYTGIIKSIQTYLQIKISIKRDRPQVIHLASSASLALFKDFLIIKVAKNSKIPVVMHWHFGRIPQIAAKRNWEWKLLSYIIRKSSSSIVMDTKSYNTLLTAGYSNVLNVPNPMGADVEQKTKSFFGKTLKRKQGRLIFVGHIVRNKGVYELVEACSQLTIVEELLLIGPCNKVVNKELKELGSKRENGKWLKFIGQLNIDQTLEYMFSSFVLALPSYTEGFPNVVLEAMAMGCAVVATDVGAIPEMLDVQNLKPCGICIPPRNVGMLKETILELFQDLYKTDNMGKNGIERVFNSYTNKIIIEQYRTIWENAVNGGSSRNLMKKVLFIAPFVMLRYKGGIMRIAEYLGQEEATKLFHESNFEIEFFNSHFLTQSKNSAGKLRLENFVQAFSFFFRLKKRMENEDYEILHFNSSLGLGLIKDLIIANILRLKFSKLILFQIHFCGIKETFLFSSLFLRAYFYLLSKFSKILLLSDSFKKELISLGFPCEKISVIHNFHQYNKVLVIKEVMHENKLSLIFIGSIDKRKGIFDLLEALKGNSFAYELNIAGSFVSNKIEKKCRNIISENNLNVSFLGYIDQNEKEKLLTEADILILPSYAEGFPMVIPEAMVFGCAIISTNIAGIPEIVKDNINGFLIEPGQVHKLKFYLEYLYRNKEILQNFKNCSVIISNKFNLPTYIEKLTAIYNNAKIIV